MAYNYFPATYQPYQGLYQQPTYQQYQQQPVINQSGIVWVSGPQEAQMYPVAPNGAVALWEKSGKTIYLKSADATGKPAIVVYDLVERVQKPPESVSDADGVNGGYATKKELEAVSAALAALQKEVREGKHDDE